MTISTRTIGYYIPTLPDTLCGAWLALTRATKENGCMWYTAGSQHEPIYPDTDGNTASGNLALRDIEPISNASHPDEALNTVSRVAAKYPGREVAVEAEPGDVVFFGGHILHRSHTNHSNNSGRSFVGHYCNARSAVAWNYKQPYEGDSANYLHILARGATHLAYAQPRFGTPCAGNGSDLYETSLKRPKPTSMMAKNGIVVLVAHEETDQDH